MQYITGVKQSMFANPQHTSISQANYFPILNCVALRGKHLPWLIKNGRLKLGEKNPRVGQFSRQRRIENGSRITHITITATSSSPRNGLFHFLNIHTKKDLYKIIVLSPASLFPERSHYYFFSRNDSRVNFFQRTISKYILFCKLLLD